MGMYYLVVLPDPIRPVTQVHKVSLTFGGHSDDYPMMNTHSVNLNTLSQGPGLVDETSHDKSNPTFDTTTYYD